MSYSSRFWKEKSYDKGIDDLDPKEFETSYTELIRSTFEKAPIKQLWLFMGRKLIMQI